MPILHNSIIATTAADDPVTRSLRFNATDDLYKATGSTNTTWTVSMWVKRSKLSSLQYLFSWGGDGINFDANDKISIWNGSSYAVSTAVFRDVSSWYHLTISCSAGTITVYVNGVSQTMSSSPSYPAWYNVYFGRWSGNSYYKFDGYLADIYGIEGSALDHTSFTESNDYGGLKPKEYTGTYGNNGFHVDAQPNNVDGELLISSISRNDGDTTFADAAQGHGLTVSGDPEHSIKVGNPHTGSDRAVYFTGSADYLTVPSSADFDFGSNNCTFEGWFLTEDFDEGTEGFFSRNNSASSNQGWSVCATKIGSTNTGELKFFESTNNTYHESGFTLFPGKWYHIALSRKGNTYRVFVDGKERIEAFLSSTPDRNVPLTIGAFYDNYAGYRLKGYCYDFRVSNGGDSYYPVDLTLPSETPSVESDTILQLDHKASGNTTATTSGSSTPSWTVNGSVHHSIGAGTPFSGDDRAMYFDGSGDYLSVPSHANLTPGTGDFTVEAWINYRGIPNSSNGSVIYAICGNGTSSSNACFMLKPNGHLGWYTGDSHYTGSSATAMSTNTWYHVAAVRSSGTVKLYIDGVEDYSATHSGNLNDTSDNRVGARTGTLLEFSGAMYDLRFSDAAKYTSSFTPPTSKLTAESDTQLLIQPDKSDTNFHDESSNGHTITATGSPTRSASTPFEAADKATSLYFYGSNDDITTGTDFIMGHAADHTFETWFYTTKNDTQYLYCHNYSQHYEGVTITPNASSSGTVIGLGGNNGNWSPVLGSEATISLNTWHHLAIVILNGQVHFYLDGVLKSVDTTHSAWTGNPSNTTIGSQRYVNGYWRYHFQGYLRDMRISDTAKYRGNFTPPSSNLESDSNTKLLIQPNNTDTAIGDETSNHTITGYGDNTDGSSSSFVTPVASTPYDAAAKSTAMYFDGNGDTVVAAASSDFAFGTGDFTVEGWWYFESIPSSTDAMLVDFRPTNNTTTTSFSFSTDTTNGVKVYSGGDKQLGGSLSLNTWHHIALVRDSGTLYAYIDGTATGTTQTLTADLSTNGTPRLGTTADGGTSAVFTGYIFDVRITKGTARYTSNFTAPSAPTELNPVYIGADQSGNKNHFAPTNISDHDIVRDVPYPKNYATLNPVSDFVTSGYANTFSNGNLTLSPSHAYNKAASTIAVSSGKWYAEVRYDSAGNQMAGIGRVDCLENTSNYIGQSSSAFGYVIYRNGGDMYHNGSTTSIFSSISSGDILQIALDLDSNTVWWGLNGTWVGTVGSSGGTSITAGEYYFVQTYRNPCTWNFGQDNTFAGQFTGTPNNAEFAYEIPGGFKSLNTSNLPSPTVTPSENFGIAVYEGNGNTRTIPVEFTPALTWIKRRDAAAYHYIADSVRGFNSSPSAKALSSNSADDENVNGSGHLTAFNSSGGFDLGTNSATNYHVNISGQDYVAWNWKAHQGGPVTRSHTMTLEVNDLYGSGIDWYNTKLEVWEGSTKLKDIEQPDYTGGGSTTYTIKTNATDKIKVVWDVDSSMDWYAMYAILKNSSNTTLASWDGNNYDGYSSTPADGSNFYIPSSHDSSNAATTGVVEGPTTVTESYNAAAGFSIITYSGNGSSDGDAQDLTHSLGAEPEFIITKARTDSYSADGGWNVYHKHNVASGYGSHPLQWLHHNWDSYKVTYSPVIPKSGSENTTITVNNDSGYGHSSNDSGATYVAYAWAPIAGYSHFGLWNADGTVPQFYHLGFRPAFVMLKCVNVNSTNWIVFDSSRETNEINYPLFPNTSGDEPSSGWGIDFLSNGFAWRNTSSEGYNGRKYIVCAWAETPAKFANAC